MRYVDHEPSVMTSLDELVAMDRRELDRLFERGDTPEPGDIEGEASGALLAGRGVFDLSGVRKLLNTSLNPWRGKSFSGSRGTNLVGYSPLSTELFDFEGYVDESVRADGTALILDYDRPSNPKIARRVRDEVRRVDEDLYLVSTHFEGLDGYRFVGYYGLDTSEEA